MRRLKIGIMLSFIPFIFLFSPITVFGGDELDLGVILHKAGAMWVDGYGWNTGLPYTPGGDWAVDVEYNAASNSWLFLHKCGARWSSDLGWYTGPPYTPGVAWAVDFEFAPSTAAGCVKAYDANDQFLGIVTTDHPDDWVRVFIPSLSAWTYIHIYECHDWELSGDRTCQETGYIAMGGCPYYDASGRAFIKKGSAFAYCSACDTYWVTGSERVRTHIVWRPANYPVCTLVEVDWPEVDIYEATEIPKANVPFTSPVAVPLRYEYQGE